MQNNDEPLITTDSASDRGVHMIHDLAYRQPMGPGAAPAIPGMRNGRGAVRGVERAARSTAEVTHPAPPPAKLEVSSLVGRVNDIIALDEDPVLRNLLITQCYHDLSTGLTRLLGSDNANWCTFATWASKTAGRFIREDEVPAALRRLIASDDAPADRHDRGGFELPTLWSSDESGLFDMPKRVLEQVSTMIAQGNLKVFSELGPLFASMIDLYDGVARPEPERLEALLEPIRTGPSPDGGQGLLRSALTHYHNAMLTDDPDRKAELILLGNARIGLHEQVRLQPYIAGSLNAPVRCLVDTVGGPAARLPEVLQSAMIEGFIRPAVEKLQALWREIATKEMMTIQLPDETLHLGSDLPAQHGQPLFSPYLATIEDPELFALLSEYGAGDSSADGSGAQDWTYLPARMGYIFELFRSRQCCPMLLSWPFTQDQREEIVCWRIPRCGNL